MPNYTKMKCPTCQANTLPAIECPHCKNLHPVDTNFVPCSVCGVSVCYGCILVIYSTTESPTCHRCSEKESTDGN